MLAIDETALIEFFGVLPEKLDSEEQEFFGLMAFRVSRQGIRLSLSLSTYDNSCYLELIKDGAAAPLLVAHMRQVREIRVMQDKAISMPVLWIVFSNRNELDGDWKQVVRIAVEPQIVLRIEHLQSTA